ncbi:uncharacterized protein MELLADRAFT_84724 [Melampsora larici-populina 98AG31]|uniref:Uncharacterized protein n=1 Tax=Melampsora larici-populina (strain 98AG31 / pathotype 3-4-7) TaxID=747676 RepID=F4RGM5_MELLP|nr:uncharacterized protein MELLADRAFT_84724 [Melampsora larici-populina 98AG31]EGG08622.1 hypothetical protein MELLADRAFT_84724 [Melampsora larici-populina 98AG31]
MIKYQEEKYDILDSQKDSPIAPRLRAHKENVLQIQIKCYGKWTPAMRYDIAHRRNVWENRLLDGSMADVGMLNVELAERAKEDAKHFNDYNYTDNPYAFGNVMMQHISPINGETYPSHASWDSNSALIDTQAEMLTGRNLSASNNQPVNQVISQAGRNSLPVLANGKTVRYKGTKFNPFYSRPNPYTPAPYVNNTDYSSNSYTTQPFYNSQPFHNNQPTFNASNIRGGGSGRGIGRGGTGRGARGGRGGGMHPAIGPGSFDKAATESAAKNAESNVGGVASSLT